MKPQQGLMALFMHHPVAANLLMVLMLLAGGLGLLKMNVQFLPNFAIDIITVEIPWPGAAADDVEKGLIYPLERELRAVDNVKLLQAQARQNVAFFLIEFQDGSDMIRASEQVRDAVARVRNFPPDSEKPIIERVSSNERIASLLIYGPSNLEELRALTWQSERELLDAGISKISVIGLPREEISIEFSPGMLKQLGRSLPELAQLIAAESQDIPAGLLGRSTAGQNLRAVQKKRSIGAFEQLRIPSDTEGQSLLLSHIANIRSDIVEEEPRIFYQGKPAVELRLYRTQQDSALQMARIAHDWLVRAQAKAGDGVEFLLFNEAWLLIRDRIHTLLYNGLGGLILIVSLLFIFLNARVALWISVGIPTALMAAMFILYLNDGSIDMISLFAFILTLGIVVDDTIVVGEQAASNLSAHTRPDEAILQACQKMLPAISASSLTTISAFLPLMLIGGTIGTVLFAIPLVVVCVILASIVECFFVLPGHLYHSALRGGMVAQTQWRQRLERAFIRFRQRRFKPLLRKALIYHPLVMLITLALMALVIALFAGGYLKFTFFPTPDGNSIRANVQFAAGTPEPVRLDFLHRLQASGVETVHALAAKEKIAEPIVVQFIKLNRSDISDFRANLGESYATVNLELLSVDKRRFRNQQVLHAWRQAMVLPAYVQSLAITAPRGGPPGQDIDIEVSGQNIADIQAALMRIEGFLMRLPGVIGIVDTLPLAQESVVFSLNARGKALGLSIGELGRQLRAGVNGEIIQRFNEPHEEIEVKVRLDKSLRESQGLLSQVLIKTPQNTMVPLLDVIDKQYKKQAEIIIHNDYQLSANLQADVDAQMANANEVYARLRAELLPELARKYNVSFRFEGQARHQAETLADIRIGLFLALGLIYIILAWVFGSYSRPLIILAVIPLGLIGAMLGHWFMGLDITLLSLFGLFGLSGILTNDAIILINEYQLLRQQGMRVVAALVEASSLRFRAIALTSITTIAGLTPLLFERSLQAQFLIPMACSITFGLVFATVLLLVVLPVLLMYLEYGQRQGKLPRLP
ncbi:MAG: efflux RND transporter permease subunit [Legionellaceae bacterium]|nr:efflux RND transporter permease subunit [Legionellaceae bacterium]